MSKTGKTINEEETLEKKLEGVMSELSSVEEEVRRYEERQEKQEKARGYTSLDPIKSSFTPILSVLIYESHGKEMRSMHEQRTTVASHQQL